MQTTDSTQATAWILNTRRELFKPHLTMSKACLICFVMLIQAVIKSGVLRWPLPSGVLMRGTRARGVVAVLEEMEVLPGALDSVIHRDHSRGGIRWTSFLQGVSALMRPSLKSPPLTLAAQRIARGPIKLSLQNYPSFTKIQQTQHFQTLETYF
jgi:hypothetical protein